MLVNSSVFINASTLGLFWETFLVFYIISHCLLMALVEWARAYHEIPASILQLARSFVLPYGL